MVGWKVTLPMGSAVNQSPKTKPASSVSFVFAAIKDQHAFWACPCRIQCLHTLAANILRGIPCFQSFGLLSFEHDFPDDEVPSKDSSMFCRQCRVHTIGLRAKKGFTLCGQSSCQANAVAVSCFKFELQL